MDNIRPKSRAEGGTPAPKVRLFANDPQVRFSGVVHEIIEDTAKWAGYKIQKADFVVHHYGLLRDDGENMIEKSKPITNLVCRSWRKPRMTLRRYVS